MIFLAAVELNSSLWVTPIKTSHTSHKKNSRKQLNHIPQQTHHMLSTIFFSLLSEWDVSRTFVANIFTTHINHLAVRAHHLADASRRNIQSNKISHQQSNTSHKKPQNHNLERHFHTRASKFMSFSGQLSACNFDLSADARGKMICAMRAVFIICVPISYCAQLSRSRKTIPRGVFKWSMRTLWYWLFEPMHILFEQSVFLFGAA